MSLVSWIAVDLSGEQVVQIVQAIAWPSLILILVLIFRRPLLSFAGRLTHLKVGGQEFVSQALAQNSSLLGLVPQQVSPPENVSPSLFNEVLALSSRDPQSALAKVSRELEMSIRRLAVASNMDTALDSSPNQLWRSIVRIAPNVNWKPDTTGFLIICSALLDLTLADENVLSDADKRRLISQGLSAVGFVEGVPRERIFVVASDLPIFEDRSLQKDMGRRAVVVKHVNPDGTETVQALLTSEPRRYKPGMEVSWEWRINPPIEEFAEGWVSHESLPAVAPAIANDFAGRDMAPLKP